MQRELGKHWHSSCSLSWGSIHPSSVDFLQAHCLSDQLCSSILIILLYVDLVNCLLLSKHLYFVLCLCWLTCFIYSILVTLSAFQTCWHCISYQLLTDFYNIYPLCPWFVNGSVTAVDRVLTMCVQVMNTRVYIGRLPDSAKDRDVERFFKGYGRIREILLKNGYGFVVWNSL